MGERFGWSTQQLDGATCVALTGTVDEDADFAPLVRELAAQPRIRLDLAGIGRINSCGVREWINFVRALPGATRLELMRCSPPVVAQINKWFSDIIAMPDTQEFLIRFGGDPWIATPEEAQARLLQDIKDWGEYVRVAKLTPQ